MTAIEVLSPGLLTTVQDLGREGFGPMGVSPSGAADAVSLRIGNRLLENAECAAGLEMTLLGGTFAFSDGAIAALTGSDFGATLDGTAIFPWTSFEVKPGQTLRLGPTRSGARCYLCFRGGISVSPFLGSASTHLLRDRKSTRLNSSHTEIYTLSLHDALPIYSSAWPDAFRRALLFVLPGRNFRLTISRQRVNPPSQRSEEHTSELQSHRDLHSFPTRRSSDLLFGLARRVPARAVICASGAEFPSHHFSAARQPTFS